MDITGKKTSTGGLSRRGVLKYGLYGGLATALGSSLWLIGKRIRQHGGDPNIILIVMDTTRVDRLGCYGYRRQTTPNLDKLAQESVLYTQAIAPSSWTLPSHASLFTGKFTTSHGAQTDADGPLWLTDAVQDPTIPNLDKNRARGLAKDEVTLAMTLKDAGYSTGAVVAGPWLKRVFGLDKGFDYYDDNEISTLNGRLAEQVTVSAVNWIKKIQQNRFFLFLNYFDPHAPYSPPETFAGAFLPKGTQNPGRQTTVYEVNALYDAEVLYMDYHIGKLLDRLKASNLYDKSWIIVTSDHGELLGEHGQFWHGHSLYQEEIHIPLFMKYPKGEGSPSRTDLRIQLTDIFPMICQRLGLDTPKNIQGSQPPHITHPIIAETYPLPLISKKGDWRVIFDGDFKFHWSSKGRHQLFNLKMDPRESINLTDQHPRWSEKMMTRLNQYLAQLPKPGPTVPAGKLDKQTRDALKSLGYVE